MTTETQRRQGCGCCILAAILILAVVGCVLIGHVKLTSDVAIVKDEGAAVVERVIEHMGGRPASTNEVEIRK